VGFQFYDASGRLKEVVGPGPVIALDAWHLIGAAGEPAFQSSWIHYSGYGAAGFRKDPTGRVALKGLIQSGTINATIFTLPAGYRPPKEMLFAPSNNQNSTTDLRVKPDGTVVLASGTNSWLSLDGIEFDTESVLSLPGAPAAGAPPLVTALPSSPPPVDGQECYFLADAANGVIWRLRYRAGSSSPYKWELVGGQRLYAVNNAGANITSATFADPPGITPPSITVPLAGDYDIYQAAQLQAPGSQFIVAAVKVGAAAAVDDDGIITTAAQDYPSRNQRKTGIAAATVIKHQYRVSGGTGGILRCELAVMPVRVG